MRGERGPLGGLKRRHRGASRFAPAAVVKDSSAGQVLAVKDGIDKMRGTVDLTDDEREALEGDRDAITALANRLADTRTPAGPTPAELGTTDTFIPLTLISARRVPPVHEGTNGELPPIKPTTTRRQRRRPTLISASSS